MDDAIDRTESKVAEYGRTRDLSCLVFEAGKTPIVFVLRPLSVVEFASCDACPTPASALLRAFMTSVQSIEGIGASPDGNLIRNARLVWVPTTRVDDGAGGQRYTVSEAEVNVLGAALGVDWLYEIGTVAYERAKLGKRIGGGVGSYTLPQSSAQELARIARRLAEHHEEQRLTMSSAGSATPSPPGSPPTSDAPTGAPALDGT